MESTNEVLTLPSKQEDSRAISSLVHIVPKGLRLKARA